MSSDLNPPAAAPIDDDDDDDIGKLLQSAQVGADPDQDFLGKLNDRDLDRGKKADDAIDYEDISDDDLPEEEFTTGAGGDSGTQNFSGTTVQDSGESFEDGGDDLDDLFGDGLSSPVRERANHHEDKPVDSIEDLLNGALSHAAKTGDARPQGSSQNVGFGAVQEDDDDDDPEWLEQKRLFEQARAGKEGDGPEAPKTSREDFEKIWPNFEENVPPRFFSLVPRNRAFYIPKVPQKQPKLMPLTKVSLEIAVDQEKSFRLPSAGPAPGSKRQLEEEQGSLIYIARIVQEEQDSDDQMELDNADPLDDHEKIGNVTWGDLKIACEDWEAMDKEPDQLMSPPDTTIEEEDDFNGGDEEWLREIKRDIAREKRGAERKDDPKPPPVKKRKLGVGPFEFSRRPELRRRLFWI